MGAEWSLDASYTLGEKLKFENKFWKIYPAVSKKDDVLATVFIHNKKQDEGHGVDKAVKYLQTLRHPGLLKYHEVFDDSEELSMVSEPVVPLRNVIEDLNIQELIAGIHSIITTVTFLHTKCKLSHNNLCVDSIFVGQNDACWKIAGLECMSSFSDMTNELLTHIKPFREQESIPPEGEKIELGCAQVQDAFGLGKLILDILNEIDKTESTVDNFQLRVEAELLHPNYQERPEISCLLNDDVFQIGYIEILDFLNNITIKSGEEKASFFRDLHHKLQDLPPKIVANRLLHLLLSRLVLVDPVAVEIFLPHLLTPLSDKPSRKADLTPLLPQELYKKSCLPILRKLFDVKDHHVRMILLKYFHLYVGMFDKDVLQNVILQELMLGLRDSDDDLVSSTFSALQHLVPLLGSKVVLGGEQTQHFTERRPKGTEFERQNLPCPKDDFDKTLLSKAKQNKSKTVEDKIKERERRREEIRKRNEERRKQHQLLQMGKQITKKACEVDKVNYKSDNDFESWGELSTETEQNIEVSDGSEHGRPSSSEISLDSGYSEAINRMPSSSPAGSPTSLRDATQKCIETNSLNKTVKGGMKLGKLWQSSKKENQINANLSSASISGEETKRTMIDKNKKTMIDKNKKTKKTSSKGNDKKKTVDAPWEDYDINVTSKNIVEEDLFADMVPLLSSAPTAPVKGTSIYSNTLAVENLQSNQVADGWNDDDW